MADTRAKALEVLHQALTLYVDSMGLADKRQGLNTLGNAISSLALILKDMHIELSETLPTLDERITMLERKDPHD